MLVILGILCILYDYEDVVSVGSHHDLVLLVNTFNYNKASRGISVRTTNLRSNSQECKIVGGVQLFKHGLRLVTKINY